MLSRFLHNSKSLSSYNPIHSGCVIYAPLWALNGVTFQTADLNHLTGTVTGATWGTKGRTFDGTDDILTLPNIATLNPLTSSWSVTVWFNSTKAARQHIVGKDSTDTYYLELTSTNYYLAFRVGDSVGGTDSIIGSTGLNDSTWHCATGVRNETDGKLYLFMDGASHADAVAATNTTTTSIEPNQVLSIGSQVGAGNPFGGTIGDVAIHGKALSLAEHTQFYNSTIWRYQ